MYSRVFKPLIKSTFYVPLYSLSLRKRFVVASESGASLKNFPEKIFLTFATFSSAKSSSNCSSIFTQLASNLFQVDSVTCFST